MSTGSQVSLAPQPGELGDIQSDLFSPTQLLDNSKPKLSCESLPLVLIEEGDGPSDDIVVSFRSDEQHEWDFADLMDDLGSGSPLLKFNSPIDMMTSEYLTPQIQSSGKTVPSSPPVPKPSSSTVSKSKEF